MHACMHVYRQIHIRCNKNFFWFLWRRKKKCRREHVVVSDCTKRNCTCPKTTSSSHHCIARRKSPCALSFPLYYSKTFFFFFSSQNNLSVLLAPSCSRVRKRKENFHNPQQLRVRDGPPCCRAAHSQSFATSPHPSQWSEEAGV